MKWFAGFIYCSLVALVALDSAINSFGTLIEQALIALAVIVTSLTMVGLYGVWKGINVFTAQTFKLLGWVLPLVTIANVVYFYIEYNDQSPWEALLVEDMIGIILTLMVGLLFIKKGASSDEPKGRLSEE